MNLLELLQRPTLSFQKLPTVEENCEKQIDFIFPENPKENFTLDVEIRVSYMAGDPDEGIPDHKNELENYEVEIANVYDWDGGLVEWHRIKTNTLDAAQNLLAKKLFL